MSQSAESSRPSSPRKTIPRPLTSPLRPSSPLPVSAAAALSPSARRASTTMPTTPPPPPGEQRSKTRARDLLRKHYGLGVGPPTPLPGKQLDPMDLDSPAFDARSYYEQLITTSTLPTLLKRENELSHEIRQLDSDRQSLVYNHHHELIAASDTIAAMKTRAESLDGELDLLKAAFSEISRLGAEVAIEQSSEPRRREDNTSES
ncbi:hypothetical protein PLICRDRAFT_178934 [Plicaturopsis crispa FD-325 SS-3]|uniref:Vacuolar protein sorting-associated protein 51 homolog n=1 Tax=Plicaturopsis crispa FD-325 SS-3 TaxID=944288 RepID=A0A0C9SS17_PLICR|nr:hypothetical protein PLICRDRAFT_178934 [Plicaturopsis crispa FD-325 SS-3]